MKQWSNEAMKQWSNEAMKQWSNKSGRWKVGRLTQSRWSNVVWRVEGWRGVDLVLLPGRDLMCRATFDFGTDLNTGPCTCAVCVTVGDTPTYLHKTLKKAKTAKTAKTAQWTRKRRKKRLRSGLTDFGTTPVLLTGWMVIQSKQPCYANAKNPSTQKHHPR